MATTKLIFFPNKLKKSKKNGKIPIYLRVLHNGVKAETRLNAEIEEHELALWNEFTMSFNQQNNRINSRIYSLKSSFEKLESVNDYNISRLTAKDIIAKLTNHEKGIKDAHERKAIYAAEYINHYYENNILYNKSYVYNTVKTYRKAVNHFLQFSKKMHLDQLEIEKFNHQLAYDFKTYLTSDYDPILKKAMTEVSASSVICKLKVIFAHAVDNEIIKKNPFSKIRLTTQSPPKPKLNINEVAKIYHLDLAEYPGLEVYRDIFIFSCFTGLSYNDVSRLTRDVITRTSSGIKITASRGKTTMAIEQLLVRNCETILNKYESDPQIKLYNLLFPRRSMTQINIHLKIIATMCKIGINLSTSIARCTCRQLLSEAGVQDTLVIHSIMGWTTKKNIDFKYYSITESLLSEAKNRFQDFIDKNILK